jgi:Ras-related protein Rab-14
MGAILVYDITNRLTYERVQQWLSSARDSAGEDLVLTDFLTEIIFSFVKKRWHILLKYLGYAHRQHFLQTVILIGNKCDLNSQRDVTFEEARQFAEENGILHAECSAKESATLAMNFVHTSNFSAACASKTHF